MIKTAREPFTAIMILLFSLAAYHDGAIWQSGACFGIGAMMLTDFVMKWQR